MQYTDKVEARLWASWDFDTSEDDYADVLQTLNAEFRPMGDGLRAVMGLAADAPAKVCLERLKQMCKEKGVPISNIGSPNTLNSWFSGGPRPKKDEKSRNAMFALAFALGLSVEDTTYLFHNVYLDRSFNQRNYRELIYYYCIDRSLSYAQAEDLISKVNFEEGDPGDQTMYTRTLAAEAAQSSSEQELIAFINSHGHNFSLNSESAKRVLLQQKQVALDVLDPKSRNHVPLYDPDEYPDVNKRSDKFLYEIITGQSAAGGTGTTTLKIPKGAFPQEIKNNFPQVISLFGNSDSFEQLRKTVILLFSFNFWARAEKAGLTDIYDDYTAQLNALLDDANLPGLYPGNPYDWMFLYCVCGAERPLDAFRGILATVLDDQE